MKYVIFYENLWSGFFSNEPMKECVLIILLSACFFKELISRFQLTFIVINDIMQYTEIKEVMPPSDQRYAHSGTLVGSWTLKISTNAPEHRHQTPKSHGARLLNSSVLYVLISHITFPL